MRAKLKVILEVSLLFLLNIAIHSLFFLINVNSYVFCLIAAFSSLIAPIQPLVERQSYIFPSMVQAMKPTVTEKGITSRHILGMFNALSSSPNYFFLQLSCNILLSFLCTFNGVVGLANGAVLELPWMFLDPRRPVTVTPEMREEGVIPYMPELPIPPESIINYNKSLPHINGIHAAPSGLESTSLVLVYGLGENYQ